MKSWLWELENASEELQKHQAWMCFKVNFIPQGLDKMSWNLYGKGLANLFP